MAKFSFRLQKVLEYREMEEEWAKDAYLAAQHARSEQEEEIARLLSHKVVVIQCPPHGLEARKHLDAVLNKLDDDVRAQRSVLALLENEEMNAQAEWNVRRQAVEALMNLHDKARETWVLDEQRKEQAEMDEWAALRRVA